MRVTILLTSVISVVASATFAQSTLRLRNSTWQDFNLEVVQSGPAIVQPTEWELLEDTVLGWWDDAPVSVFQCSRTNSAVAEGDTAIFDILLQGAMDTLQLRMRLIGLDAGTSMEFAISGPGFSQPWSDSPDFQELETTLFGKNTIIKCRPDNDDATQQRNVFFTLHDLPIYEIDETDFSEPNVMNAMFYNIQMLPFGVSGMLQANDRAALLPAQISPYQDVVVFEELFDDVPRESHMIPAMADVGFIYHTEILNPNNSIIPIPWNGGVIIFSRWPIEFEDDFDFSLCGQASQDCLANKGIKYARVNKLGKKYHIFGTHMDAGGEADDILAKRTQMGEMRDFIDVQNIPDGEPVIFGGDFNVAPTHELNLYPAMLDSIGPYIPHPIGYPNSTFSGDFGKVIDNVWGDRSHLVALESTNEVITMRSLEPVLWELGEFSDHRCALGRFVYPDIEMVGAGDTVLCPGESITFGVESDTDVSYQWEKDSEELAGEIAAELVIADATEAHSGQYRCVVRYDVIYGNVDDSLTQVFYPFGIDTVRSVFNYEFGQITVSQPLCELSVEETAPSAFTVYPNPSEGLIDLQFSKPILSGRMEVLDMIGRTVIRQQISGSNATMDLAANPSGIYLLMVEVDGIRSNQRIVLE
ncbi:MAG: T9SS type A sorting domain-containing protein [Flavobacteriales bacterium]|nr:T9SS type A sorting domain-containing protein [Flavobacteriales bacterium]